MKAVHDASEYNEMIAIFNQIGKQVERENAYQKLCTNSSDEVKDIDKAINRALKHKKHKERKNMEAYQVSMLNEYQELKERYNKLHKMLVKYDAGTLNFTPTCPIELLRKQKSLMGQYLNVLEIRAEIEGIDLDYEAE